MIEVKYPRLAHHVIQLASGHRVGVSVCGQGIPLVVIHGFAAEGILYSQTLARLVELGFCIVAVDTPGHGDTSPMRNGGATMAEYARLLAEVIDELGITKAVFLGHSMGGRLVVEVAAQRPDLALAVIPIDAVIGDSWDRLVYACRFVPPTMLGLGALLAVDTLSTAPMLRNPRQALKLMRLAVPTGAHELRHPWQLVGPARSIMRSGPSAALLDRLRFEQIPTIVIHSDRDLVVPFSAGRAAAQRVRGTFVAVHGAFHSWLLTDPDALPAMLVALSSGALRDVLAADSGECYARIAPVKHLLPNSVAPTPQVHRSRYRFTITSFEKRRSLVPV